VGATGIEEEEEEEEEECEIKHQGIPAWTGVLEDHHCIHYRMCQ
jgi:hypothetical protein